jgi:hypothetical protein
VLKRKVRRQSQFGTESSRRRELSLGTPLFTFPMNEASNQSTSPPVPPVVSGGGSGNTGLSVSVSGGASGGGGGGGGVTVPAVKKVGNSLSDNRGPGDYNSAGVRRRRQGQQQQMSQMLMQEEEEEQQQQQLDSALKRRSTARGIESEIEKLGEVFQRFSSLIAEQVQAPIPFQTLFCFFFTCHMPCTHKTIVTPFSFFY